MSVLYTGEGGAPSKASSSSLSSPESAMPDPAPRRRRTVNTDGPLRMDRHGRAIILPPEMRSVFWGFYQLAPGVALPAAGPVLLARRGSHYLPTLAGRLGRAPAAGSAPAAGPGAVWLHAVSVGEVGVAATLARALSPEVPLLVTPGTPTGQERAR